MKTLWHRLWKEEEGQTLIEYALILALISIVAIGILTVLGKKVSNTFNSVSSKLAE